MIKEYFEDERFDDICLDLYDGSAFTQVCTGCNDRHGFEAEDVSVCVGLICGVRGCQNEADFYLELEAHRHRNCEDHPCADCQSDAIEGEVNAYELSQEAI